MDVDTIVLLKECSSGCHMAMDSVKKMRQYVKTPELNRLLEAYGEKHRRLEGEIADQLESFGESESAPGKMAEVMAKADSLSKWAADVMAYATAQAIEQGKHFDNWKVVEGRSVRKFNASDEAIEEAAKAAGYTDIYNRSLITLTAFEKLMGKDTFQDVLGGFVEKPAGKLTLVPTTDKRPEVVITHNDDFND